MSLHVFTVCLRVFYNSSSFFACFHITRFGGRCCWSLQQLGVAHHRSSGVGKTVWHGAAKTVRLARRSHLTRRGLTYFVRFGLVCFVRFVFFLSVRIFFVSIRWKGWRRPRHKVACEIGLCKGIKCWAQIFKAWLVKGFVGLEQSLFAGFRLEVQPPIRIHRRCSCQTQQHKMNENFIPQSKVLMPQFRTLSSLFSHFQDYCL